MAFAIRWQSQQGTRTTDNRDCAGIGIRQTEVLAIVLDGSSSGANSGVFASEIARRIVDWFVSTDQAVTVAVLTAQLRATRAELTEHFQRDSASYLLIHVGKSIPEKYSYNESHVRRAQSEPSHTSCTCSDPLGGAPSSRKSGLLIQ